MKTRPVTENCSENFKLRNHVCFGISPFNSYFSEAQIQRLAEWGRAEFKEMHFFVPDVPSAYTLEALGYDSEKAGWKARRQSQYLFNKIHRALKNLGYSSGHAEEMILNWNKLTDIVHYQNLYSEVKSLFEKDNEFRQACIEASRWVLEKRVQNSENIRLEVLESAVRYLLTEIPLFINTAGILQKSSSVFCYHQCIPFIEKLIKNCFDLSASASQGFVVVEPIEIIDTPNS